MSLHFEDFSILVSMEENYCDIFFLMSKSMRMTRSFNIIAIQLVKQHQWSFFTLASSQMMNDVFLALNMSSAIVFRVSCLASGMIVSPTWPICVSYVCPIYVKRICMVNIDWDCLRVLYFFFNPMIFFKQGQIQIVHKIW